MWNRLSNEDKEGNMGEAVYSALRKCPIGIDVVRPGYLRDRNRLGLVKGNEGLTRVFIVICTTIDRRVSGFLQYENFVFHLV